MATLKELQAVINDAYRRGGGGYNEAAQAYGNVSEFNKLVVLRDAMKSQPQPKVSVAVDNVMKHVAVAQNKKRVVPLPHKSSGVPGVSLFGAVKDAFYDVSDKLTGWAYKRKEQALDDQVKKSEIWSNERFNDFLLNSESSPISKEVQDSLKTALPNSNTPLIILDSIKSKLGYWDEDAQKWVVTATRNARSGKIIANSLPENREQKKEKERII